MNHSKSKKNNPFPFLCIEVYRKIIARSCPLKNPKQVCIFASSGNQDGIPHKAALVMSAMPAKTKSISREINTVLKSITMRGSRRGGGGTLENH